MENQPTSDKLTLHLAQEFRIVTLEGAAVIAHGFGRNTYDADIWLDPLDSPTRWVERFAHLLNKFGFQNVHPIAIGTWQPIPDSELVDAVREDGVIRIAGLDRPLDIFRAPNELDTVDLLVTKQDTGRDKDLQDIAFLEAKAEREYLAKLPATDADEAMAMLERFLTPRVAEAAMAHPAESVRELGLRFLREMAEEGNPFAGDLLRGFEQRGSA